MRTLYIWAWCGLPILHLLEELLSMREASNKEKSDEYGKRKGESIPSTRTERSII